MTNSLFWIIINYGNSRKEGLFFIKSKEVRYLGKEGDLRMYYIVSTYEDRYLRADNTITTAKDQAIKFETREDAQNLIDHRLPKLIRNCLGDVHIINDNELDREDIKYKDFNMSLTNKELVKEMLSSLMSKVKIETLRDNLSILDKMLSDISHYRENVGRSSDGLDDLERSILIKRREIKNEIRYILLIDKMFKTKDQINIKELVDEYNSIEKGEFKPRVLKGLFGDNEIIPKFEDIWTE